MKYSLNMLKQYISISDDIKTIANKLTLKSCEIEHIDERTIPNDVVIGFVTDVKQHPNADKLMVCQVDCGDKGAFQIVTGGENVEKGTYVPTAIPGCYLPVIDLKIGERQMRGEDSNGMICSKEELGINEDMDQHWIWTLDKDFKDLEEADKGKPLTDKYPRLDNYILDVDNKTLTHRPDLTGYFGLGMELNAIHRVFEEDAMKISFNKAVTIAKELMDTNILQNLQEAAKANKKVTSETDGLRSYILVELNDIKVSESSIFNRVALRDIEAQPINNWVDFSNLFMNLTSQPVHFFDADKINGDIIVRQAKNDEKFVDLTGEEHSLTPDDMVIADKDKVLALAGVFGSNLSGVTEETKNIIIEIANFDPIRVRKTALRLGLRTDASMRYEKNINPVFTLHSFLLLMDLMKYHKTDLGDYTFGGINYFINDSIDLAPRMIEFDTSHLAQTLRGRDATDEDEAIMKFALEGLGCGRKDKGDKVQITVPHRRGPGDMNIKEDLYEEVVRIHGYEHIEPLSLNSETKPNPFPIDVEVTRSIEKSLSAICGYDQLETYPRANDKLMAELGNHKVNEDKTIDGLLSLINTLSPETKNLRDKMLYNLFAYTAKNAKFFDEMRVFDTGKVWNEKNEEGEKYYGVPGSPAYEKLELGAILYQKKVTSWEEDNVLLAKANIAQIFNDLGLNGKIEYTKTEDTNYHPQKQGTIMYNRQPIGFIGQVHPLLVAKHKMDQNSQLTYFTLDIDKVIEWASKRKNKKSPVYETIKDQIVMRDLCFVIDADKDFSEVITSVKGTKSVEAINIFDLYQGEHLPEGKKSIALRMKIKGDGTMTTEAINDVMDKAIERAEATGAQLRK